jgi:hypothetical protein
MANLVMTFSMFLVGIGDGVGSCPVSCSSYSTMKSGTPHLLKICRISSFSVREKVIEVLSVIKEVKKWLKFGDVNNSSSNTKG